jgi:beta-phosphoglucomutase-like phosphatase (HAD superfamily)
LEARTRFIFICSQNCAVVEDSILGIKAAQRAGMQSFFYQPQKVSLLKTDNTISFQNMLELPSLINHRINDCN